GRGKDRTEQEDRGDRRSGSRREPTGTQDRAGRRRRLQRGGLHFAPASWPTDLDDRGSVRWKNSTAHAARAEEEKRITGVCAGTPASYGRVQRPAARLRRRKVRPAIATAGGAASVLPHGRADRIRR